jgi:hypothetical protein
VASVGGLATSARGTAVGGGSTGISGATVAVEKHLTGLRLVILVQLRLFQEHVGAHAHEGMVLAVSTGLTWRNFLFRLQRRFST